MKKFLIVLIFSNSQLKKEKKEYFADNYLDVILKINILNLYYF